VGNANAGRRMGEEGSAPIRPRYWQVREVFISVQWMDGRRRRCEAGKLTDAQRVRV
jgi:hypothetical protein